MHQILMCFHVDCLTSWQITSCIFCSFPAVSSTLSVTRDVSIFKLEDPRRETRKALPSTSQNRRASEDEDDDE